MTDRMLRLTVLLAGVAAVLVWGLIFATHCPGQDDVSSLPAGWDQVSGTIVGLSDDGNAGYWMPDCAKGEQCISGGRMIDRDDLVLGQAFSLTMQID